MELILKAYPTAECCRDTSPAEIAFSEAKKSLSDKELDREKPLRLAYIVAQAKLQEAYNELRSQHEPIPANS